MATARRQHHAAAALLVLPLQPTSIAEEGRRHDDCHAHEGENQYHAIMNNQTCAMVHPSSTAVPLLAMNAQVELTSKQGKRTVAMNRVLRRRRKRA